MTMQCDVLIVGAGPVGLVSASMFERLGVNAIVVERRPGLHTAPQAHVISTRSLEICRAIGLDDGIIRQRGPSPIDLASVRWVDHLLGRDLGVFLFMENPERIMQMMSQTPTPTCQLSQDQFEDVLANHLADGAPVLFEHNWTGFSETANGYMSRIQKADGTMLDIESRFIVAADGAGSPVRAAIGFDMEGPDQIQSYVNVHFHANMREELKGREGALYWIMDPECEGCFIAHNIEGNWIYMKTLDPDSPRVDIDEAHYERLLRMAIGADIDIDIQSMSA
ncbi:MAG: FAD-dependent monooxygenase, partial [Pseudomonadota bacterium]